MSDKLNETTVADASGAFDVPFLGTTPKGSKDPLKINGVKSIKSSKSVIDKNFPKWGGEGGYFIKIKDKCNKFPYCNQGDDNFEIYENKNIQSLINEISEETNVPKKFIFEVIKENIDIY